MKRRRARPDDDRLEQWNLDDMTDPNRSDILPHVIKTNEDMKKSQREFQSISWLWPLVILAFGCLLYYLIHLQDHSLPRVVSKIEAEENPKLFSAERSRNSLRKLTNLGPRVVGDVANEVHAPLIIENEVKDIQFNAHSSQSISVQRQKGSGAYYLGFKFGFTNIYDNIQNVLVLMEGSEGNHSILINCHYDSVPASPGASDDGISCAIMLELIRVFSLSDKRLKHNLVFLFNGAEEVPLQGAHLFLQHEWSKKCRILLNLEAAGQGGRATLFQSGPKHSWLFDYYAKNAPHPHALVMSEELFQNGFIPSDTDFRIFRDYGKMAGFDFAYARNGYVYHTIYDSEEYIPLGSHQHLGDNLLAVIKELGFAPELENMEENSGGEVVYYDYVGLFMISYSTKFGTIINILTIIVAVFSIVVYIGRLLKWSWLPQCSGHANEKSFKMHFKSKSNTGEPSIEVDTNLESTDTENKEHDLVHRLNTPNAALKELSIAVLACVSSQNFSIAMVALISTFIHHVAKLVMPWYSNTWIIFPIYWCPCLVAYATIPYLTDLRREKNRNLTSVGATQLNLIAAQIPMIFIFLVFTCFGIRSSAIFLFPVLSSAIANLLLHLTNLHKTVHKWIVVYILVHLPSLIFQLYIVLLANSLLIAIAGRSGAINSDLYLGVVSALLSIYSISFLMPLMGVVKKRLFTMMVLSAFSIIVIIISLTTSVGFPYKAGPKNPAPQRYWIMHADREFYNESQILRKHQTGFFILNQDPNSPRTVPEKFKSEIRSMKSDCETELNCGLPYHTTRMLRLGPSSSWIPASPPQIPNKVNLNVLKLCRTIANESICQLKCSLQGPDRMTLTFSPRDGAKLIGWSVPSPAIPTTQWKDRPFYYMHLVRGEIIGNYNITLDFHVTSEQKNGSPIVDIGLAGNHVHHESERTKDFQDFLKSFPEWTTMMGWISAYKAYVF